MTGVLSLRGGSYGLNWMRRTYRTVSRRLWQRVVRMRRVRINRRRCRAGSRWYLRPHPAMAGNIGIDPAGTTGIAAWKLTGHAALRWPGTLRRLRYRKARINKRRCSAPNARRIKRSTPDAKRRLPSTRRLPRLRRLGTINRMRRPRPAGNRVRRIDRPRSSGSARTSWSTWTARTTNTAANRRNQGHKWLHALSPCQVTT